MYQSNKERYGLVETPPEIVSRMLNLLPVKVWESQDCRWLDPGCGTGNFAREIAKRLSKYHDIKRVKSAMLDLVDINEDMLLGLREDGYNCKCADFIEWSGDKTNQKYDVIVGNPPYNFGGIKKVPSNKVKDKKCDGKTIWPDFVKHSIELLRPNGYLCFITPALWLKKDNAGLNQLLLHNHDIHISHIYSMTDVETNRAFRGEAQIASTIFLLQKSSCQNTTTKIWDSIIGGYIDYDCAYPVPLYGVSIANKLLKWVNTVGKLDVIKTNTVGVGVNRLSAGVIGSVEGWYPAIRTCILVDGCDGMRMPRLCIEYSDVPCPHYGRQKLIMAHKRLGFPYLDVEGKYGISARDNYVIYAESIAKLRQIQAFLSTKFARYIFGVTSYRMKFLEKYVFELIPDVTRMPGFPLSPTDADISAYFSFTLAEDRAIDQCYTRRYGNFLPP
jgi:tRNA1(Val) A37 N6-methylase TrmN6